MSAHITVHSQLSSHSAQPKSLGCSKLPRLMLKLIRFLFTRGY